MEGQYAPVTSAVGAGKHAAAIKLLDELLAQQPEQALRLLLLLDRGSCQAALGLNRKAGKVCAGCMLWHTALILGGQVLASALTRCSVCRTLTRSCRLSLGTCMPSSAKRASCTSSSRARRELRAAAWPCHSCSQLTLRENMQAAEQLLAQACSAYAPGSVAAILQARSLLESSAIPASSRAVEVNGPQQAGPQVRPAAAADV